MTVDMMTPNESTGEKMLSSEKWILSTFKWIPAITYSCIVSLTPLGSCISRVNVTGLLLSMGSQSWA